MNDKYFVVTRFVNIQTIVTNIFVPPINQNMAVLYLNPKYKFSKNIFTFLAQELMQDIMRLCVEGTLWYSDLHHSFK
jgi:hypothetical protein